MKRLFVAAFLLSTVSAFADCNREAQFIGKVKNLKMLESSFTFQVGISRWFVPSMVCPMHEDELQEAVVEIQGKPSIKNGDEISGIMVFDQETQSYKID
jgi:hypothetical protein